MVLRYFETRILLDHSKKRLAKAFKHFSEELFYAFVDDGRSLLQPDLHNEIPVQALRVHVEHATSGDGGGGRGLHVLSLKDQICLRRQLDYLTRHQAKLFVLIQDRVHALDPF